MTATTTSDREFHAPGGELPRLAESVLRLAAERPAEPALCFRNGWDWAWWTWAQLAEAASPGRGGDVAAAAGDPEAVAALVAADRDLDRDRAGSARVGAPGVAPAEPPPLPPPGRWRRLLHVPAREVVVEVFPTSEPARVDWLRWAVARGAALVAAPSQSTWLEVVLFARPTVLWGGAPEASTLLDRARGRRRSIDRLRAFAWTDAVGAPPDMASRFAAVGVALVEPGPAVLAADDHR